MERLESLAENLRLECSLAEKCEAIEDALVESMRHSRIANPPPERKSAEDSKIKDLINQRKCLPNGSSAERSVISKGIRKQIKIKMKSTVEMRSTATE